MIAMHEMHALTRDVHDWNIFIISTDFETLSWCCCVQLGFHDDVFLLIMQLLDSTSAVHARIVIMHINCNFPLQMMFCASPCQGSESTSWPSKWSYCDLTVVPSSGLAWWERGKELLPTGKGKVSGQAKKASSKPYPWQPHTVMQWIHWN